MLVCCTDLGVLFSLKSHPLCSEPSASHTCHDSLQGPFWPFTGNSGQQRRFSGMWVCELPLVPGDTEAQGARTPSPRYGEPRAGLQPPTLVRSAAPRPVSRSPAARAPTPAPAAGPSARVPARGPVGPQGCGRPGPGAVPRCRRRSRGGGAAAAGRVRARCLLG